MTPQTKPAKTGDRLIVVARIAGAFGVKGEVRIVSFTDDPRDAFKLGPLLNEAGQVVFEPKSVRPIKDGFGVLAKQNKTREDWEALKGTLLHVPRSALPAPEDESFYVEDLVGLAVFHADGRTLGRVVGLENFGAQDLIEIMPPSGPDGRKPQTYFLPFTKDCVPVVDVENGRIEADPDEALLPDSLASNPNDTAS
jgi:16S rRNA processing protein RimM